MQTPLRFRTKRQLWAYCGLALKTSTSGEYRIVEAQLKRSKKFLAIRGLNANRNHDLKNIFKGAATRAAAVPGTFSRASRRFSSPRDEANDGAPHSGAQDRCHHFDRLEERSSFRRRTYKTTNSLSASHRARSISGSSLVVASRFLRRSGSRESINLRSEALLASAPSHRADPMPPRTTRKSHRPRVSDRTMVDTKPPFCLFVSSTAWRRHGHRMKPPRWKIEIATSGDESKLWALGPKKSLHHYVGWKSEMFRPQERCFFLTSLFIEPIRMWEHGLP
jgi:hypothetical protein